MLVKLSIKVVTGPSTGGCFIVHLTEVTIDGDKDLVDAIIKQIKEIPGVEVE